MLKSCISMLKKSTTSKYEKLYQKVFNKEFDLGDNLKIRELPLYVIPSASRGREF